MGGELIAREHELVEIAVGLHSGAGALVSGDAGVGKTALVSAAVDRLTSAGRSGARIVATAASRSCRSPGANWKWPASPSAA